MIGSVPKVETKRRRAVSVAPIFFLSISSTPIRKKRSADAAMADFFCFRAILTHFVWVKNQKSYDNEDETIINNVRSATKTKNEKVKIASHSYIIGWNTLTPAAIHQLTILEENDVL